MTKPSKLKQAKTKLKKIDHYTTGTLNEFNRKVKVAVK